jgi:hypothetical protein
MSDWSKWAIASSRWESAKLPTFGTPWANDDEYKITLRYGEVPPGFDSESI